MPPFTAYAKTGYCAPGPLAIAISDNPRTEAIGIENGVASWPATAEFPETFWRLVTLIHRAQSARRYVRGRLLVVVRAKSVRIAGRLAIC